jgi:hypothetical protein
MFAFIGRDTAKAERRISRASFSIELPVMSGLDF